MKTYIVYFEEMYKVYIEAKDKKEAKEMFYDGTYDNVHNLAINMIDIEEEPSEQIIGQDENGFYTDKEYVTDEIAIKQGYVKE